MFSNEIEQIKDPLWFKNFVKGKEILVSPPATDRLDQGQRLIFTEETLRLPILRDTPNFIAIQKNGRYTVYYKRKEHYLNIILEVKGERSLQIISFMKKRILPI